jgi:hypothetical protein
VPYEEAVDLPATLPEPHTFLPFGLFLKSKLRPLLDEIDHAEG